MRVLIVPELYRPNQASANGTVNDAITWVEQWLDRNGDLHVYWLLPPRERASYNAEYVLADRDRVTLLEAEPLMSGSEYEYLFTETGYSEAQLLALKEDIYDQLGYVDVVVDQLRRGRADLYKWLLLLSGHRASQPVPFAVVANVHDLQLPYKYRVTGYRNDFQRQTEIADAVFADSMWFKAHVDADGMREYGSEFFHEGVLDAALDNAVFTDSPIDFSRFEELYSDEPEWLHVAGSIWRKKHPDHVMAISEFLHDEFGIRTVVTSMSEIPARYADLPWVEAHSHASRRTYEAALQKGDLAVCATEYETLARTWFEQAASGQVLILRDKDWIYDCVPDDYRFIGELDDLADLAAWAVEHWDDAVAENKRMMEYVRQVRDPERSGRETYDDMAGHVSARLEAYKPNAVNDIVESTLAAWDDDQIALDELVHQSVDYTDTGQTVLEHDEFSLGELVLTLRNAGLTDTGNPGTPVFEWA